MGLKKSKFNCLLKIETSIKWRFAIIKQTNSSRHYTKRDISNRLVDSKKEFLLWKFLPVWEVSAVWIIVNKTSQMGKVDIRRWWTSCLDLSSLSESPFSFFTSRLGKFRIIFVKTEV